MKGMGELALAIPNPAEDVDLLDALRTGTLQLFGGWGTLAVLQLVYSIHYVMGRRVGCHAHSLWYLGPGR